MHLTPYVDNLRAELLVAAEAGGHEARELAERLTAALDSATRLVLLNALSAAAAEITTDLAPGAVDLRLRGGEPEFVLTAATTPAQREAEPAERAEPAATGDDGPMTRINLRLPEGLKAQVESAADAEGRSVNAWLVRAAATALDSRTSTQSQSMSSTAGRQHYTGWVH